jgi:hypothetical protein
VRERALSGRVREGRRHGIADELGVLLADEPKAGRVERAPEAPELLVHGLARERERLGRDVDEALLGAVTEPKPPLHQSLEDPTRELKDRRAPRPDRGVGNLVELPGVDRGAGATHLAEAVAKAPPELAAPVHAFVPGELRLPLERRDLSTEVLARRRVLLRRIESPSRPVGARLNREHRRVAARAERAHAVTYDRVDPVRADVDRDAGRDSSPLNRAGEPLEVTRLEVRQQHEWRLGAGALKGPVAPAPGRAAEGVGRRRARVSVRSEASEREGEDHGGRAQHEASVGVDLTSRP